MTDIIFFDANGKDLPVKKTKVVERLFFGEDFVRSAAEKVGTIYFPERTTETYREQFLAALDLDAIRKAKFKIVIDYSNGVAATIFPTVLGAFDCHVLALNAHLDPKRLTRDAVDIGSSLHQLSHIVTSLKYDLGCMIDVVGERITLVDERGNAIDNDRLLALVTKVFLHLHPHTKKIAVPITSSGEVDVLAREHGVSVVKTRNTHLAMMEATADKEVHFVGGTKGGFIYTDFFFASDGMFSLAKILEMMAKTGWHLGTLSQQLPKLFRVKKEVKCPWDTKGKVMRHVMRETEQQQRELVDGVRLVFDGTESGAISVMLLPDKERPLFHITAEGATQEAALQLAEKYEQQVIRWRDN